jgi:hypothetical protein
MAGKINSIENFIISSGIEPAIFLEWNACVSQFNKWFRMDTGFECASPQLSKYFSPHQNIWRNRANVYLRGRGDKNIRAVRSIRAPELTQLNIVPCGHYDRTLTNDWYSVTEPIQYLVLYNLWKSKYLELKSKQKYEKRIRTFYYIFNLIWIVGIKNHVSLHYKKRIKKVMEIIFHLVSS